VSRDPDSALTASLRSFDGAYKDTPPWDIGRPQAEIVRLAQQGAIKGRVLDVGCGTGENALYLAEQGLEVWGVDGAPQAIEQARAKATERGLSVPSVVMSLISSLLAKSPIWCMLYPTICHPPRTMTRRTPCS
jgi:SAM-dependent methyltransferase